MYELNKGTERLVNALKCVSDADMNRLANILHYMPGQLKQDIQALSDYYKEHED